jgi:heme-degrading monooxygenase HmoA
MHMLLIEGAIKPGIKDDFLKAWERQILPTLKAQKGFVDEILVFNDESESEGVGLSFWQTKEDADRYYNDVFPMQTDRVGDMLADIPKVRSCSVEHAGIFNIAARRAA